MGAPPTVTREGDDLALDYSEPGTRGSGTEGVSSRRTRENPIPSVRPARAEGTAAGDRVAARAAGPAGRGRLDPAG